jgi:hypothetical protein
MTRSRLRRHVSWIAPFAVPLALAPAALPAEPLPVTSLAPANGASFTVPAPTTFDPFQVELKSGPKLFPRTVEVSTSNLPGQDGSLADDFLVDSIYLFDSDAFPGTYTGKNTATASWVRTPGTYYWQVKATCSWLYPECGGSGGSPYQNREYLSDVRTITVLAPSAPPAPPAAGGDPGAGNPQTPSGIRWHQIRGYLRYMIRKETNGRVRKLGRSCSGIGSPRVACYATWRIGRHRYAGTARLVHSIDGAEQYWYYTFKGTKKKLGCRRCHAKRLRWR